MLITLSDIAQALQCALCLGYTYLHKFIYAVGKASLLSDAMAGKLKSSAMREFLC